MIDHIRRPTVEEQIRRQVENYLYHHSSSGDPRVVPVGVALDMCIFLNKHLTDRLEAYEKIALDQLMMKFSTTLMPPIPDKPKDTP